MLIFLVQVICNETDALFNKLNKNGTKHSLLKKHFDVQNTEIVDNQLSDSGLFEEIMRRFSLKITCIKMILKECNEVVFPWMRLQLTFAKFVSEDSFLQMLKIALHSLTSWPHKYF